MIDKDGHNTSLNSSSSSILEIRPGSWSGGVSSTLSPGIKESENYIVTIRAGNPPNFWAILLKGLL